jgi:hypothetical protein
MPKGSTRSLAIVVVIGNVLEAWLGIVWWITDLGARPAYGDTI